MINPVRRRGIRQNTVTNPVRSQGRLRLADITMSKPNILIVSNWYPAGPMRDIADAFERMGHKVFRIGPAFNGHMGVDWKDQEVHPDLETSPGRDPWGMDRFLDEAAKRAFMADAILVSDDYNSPVEPTTKAPVALWSFDGWPHVYKRVELFQPTIAYHNHPYGIRIHPQDDIPQPWKYMPAACAPWKHVDLGLDRDVDFALMATMYGYRPILCAYLRDNGLLVLSGQVGTPEYVTAYNRALFTYHNTNGNGHEVKFRFFEAAAMGCVNFCDDWVLLEKLGYLPWVHFVPIEARIGTWADEEWPSAESIRSRIEDLKTSPPGTIEEISSKARLHTIFEHTYYHRAQTILSDLGFLSC